VLGADDRIGLGLDDWHARSAEMYVATQRPDGSWPHRVWPRDGALAPGWANARIEDGPDVDYQADQTGSVIAYLAQARAAGVDVEKLDDATRRRRSPDSTRPSRPTAAPSSARTRGRTALGDSRTRPRRS